MDYSKYFPITEYYQKVVQPVNPRHYRMKSDSMMVCPLHDDVNPSMGIMYGSNGSEIYHCFGCGKWGDVVDLNIKVNRRLFKRYISEEESLRQLCKLFGVDRSELPSESEEKLSEDLRIEKELIGSDNKFDFSDFRRMFTEGKLKKKGLPYFNTLMMVMVNEIKIEEAKRKKRQ